MEIRKDLRIAIENCTANVGLSELKSDSQKLSMNYRTNSGKGERLLKSDKEAIAYSAARMPATYGSVLTALEYALELTSCNPETLLDVGAGTGAAIWAADSLLDLNEITCLEREAAMIRVGKNLVTEAPEPLCNAKWVRHNLIEDALTIKADLVIASYVLNEMNPKDRAGVIKKIWDASIMMLLIIEPGTPEGYKQMMEYRKILLGLGAHITAPCPHETACKVDEKDWCHFVCRVPRSQLHRQLKEGDAPYEDEKFTYIAVTREKNQSVDSRIIRHPYIEKGHVTLNVCRPDKISNMVIYKKDNELYKQARKAKCGDAIDLKSCEKPGL